MRVRCVGGLAIRQKEALSLGGSWGWVGDDERHRYFGDGLWSLWIGGEIEHYCDEFGGSFLSCCKYYECLSVGSYGIRCRCHLDRNCIRTQVVDSGTYPATARRRSCNCSRDTIDGEAGVGVQELPFYRCVGDRVACRIDRSCSKSCRVIFLDTARRIPVDLDRNNPAGITSDEGACGANDQEGY